MKLHEDIGGWTPLESLGSKDYILITSTSNRTNILVYFNELYPWFVPRIFPGYRSVIKPFTKYLMRKDVLRCVPVSVYFLMDIYFDAV